MVVVSAGWQEAAAMAATVQQPVAQAVLVVPSELVVLAVPSRLTMEVER